MLASNTSLCNFVCLLLQIEAAPYAAANGNFVAGHDNLLQSFAVSQTDNNVVTGSNNQITSEDLAAADGNVGKISQHVIKIDVY